MTMKKIIFFITAIFAFGLSSTAQQQFIDKAKIEFQVTTNNYKSVDGWFGDNENESSWQENIKSNMSKLSISYYDYTFSNNRSIYNFNHLDPKNKMQWDNDINYEGNTWYYDFNNGTSAFNRTFWGDEFNFTDSIKEIAWKLVPTESRIIAGFNCRKAYTILFDSVYVFAFYTDEITISGGPIGLHGLPGMILGVTVPRMYSSWIATKINITGVDEKKIASPAGKKSKTKDEVIKKFMKKAEEDGKWMQRNIWSLFL
jgi:GLPGLI family protein